MPLPKLRFNWRPVAIDDAKWHLGLFCFYDARAKSAGRIRAWRLAFSVRGVLLWLAALAAVAYLGAAIGLSVWFGRQPDNHVTFADVVWPPHWTRLQEKRGESQIARGLDDFKNHQWMDGQMALSAGLRHAPRNTSARLALTEFYVAINSRTRAKAVLTEGMNHGFPGLPYFSSACALAAEGGDYDWWISLCDTALGQLADRPAADPDRQAVLRQKMSALLAADRANDVVKLVDAQGADAIPVWGEFKAIALLKAGRAADAVTFLDAWGRRSGMSAQIMRLQVRAFREAGRLDDMEQAINKLCEANPSGPQYFIYGIIQRILAGRNSEADRNIDTFLLQFGGSPRILFQLAEPLQEIDAKPQLQRLIKYVRGSGFDPVFFDIVLLRVLVDQGDWVGVRALLATVRAEQKTPTPSVDLWENMIDRLSNAALDPSSGVQSALVDFARGRRLSLKIDLQFVRLLRDAGRPATARALITFGEGVYPENAALRGLADELDGELAAAAKAAPQPVIVPVVVSDKAVTAVVDAASLAPLGGEVDLKEDGFFKQIADAEKTGDFAGALQKVQALRQAQPDWMSARESDLEIAEIRINGRLGDLVGLKQAAGFYLNGDTKHVFKATDLANELHAAGCNAAAIFLAQQILNAAPGFPPAKRMVADWAPQPVTTKSMPKPAGK